MSKIFKKFSTRLFLGIVIFLISIVVVILINLRINRKAMKKDIKKSYDGVELEIEELADTTWYENYMSMLRLVGNEETNAINYVFDSIKNNLTYLATEVTSSYENNKTSNIPINPPDKNKDGEVTAQLILEPGVNKNATTIKNELKILSNVSDNLINFIKNSMQVQRGYIVTDTGIMVIVDNSSADKYDENGNLITLTHRDKIWYETAISTSSVIVSDVVEDVLTDNNTVVFLKSFDINGKRKGAICFEIYTKLLSEEKIGLNIREDIDVFIFDRNGGLVFSDSNEFVPNDNVIDYAVSCYRKESVIGNCYYAGKKNLVYNQMIKSCNWILLVLIEENIVKADVKDLTTLISDTNNSLIKRINSINKASMRNLSILCIVIIFISFFIAKAVSNLFSISLIKLTNQISEANVENLEKVDENYTTEELQNLATTFNAMIDKTKDYLNHIESITREKENIKAELDVAKKIQQDMLPTNFDTVNSRKDINISAINIPETEVGGDFYNYILVNNKLFLIIADVSGSGVPASLFMAKTNYLINSAIKLSNSPKVILSYVNSELCKNNEENYFVTISIYYVDLATRKIISTNAGHENPILIKADGGIEMIKENKTAPIGITNNLIFEENTIELDEGDTLFLYTDGVVEAINDKDELYGDMRLLSVLKNTENNNAGEIIEKVKTSVMSFSNVPEQYDDITMLCFKFNKQEVNFDPNKVHRFNKEFTDKYGSIEEINTFIEKSLNVAYDDNVDKYKSFLNRLEVCTEEIVVNIIDYAYKDIIIEDLKKIYVEVEVDRNIDKVTIYYTDNGPEFDPTKRDDPNILKSAKDRKIGGLGIYLTKQVVDSMEYEYINNQNKLKLVKFL